MPCKQGFQGWVAGLIDGAGEVKIERRVPGLREGNLEAAYHVAVRFVTADQRTANAVRSAYGGRLQPARRNRRSRLALGGEESVRLLRDVRPYLVAKREQAEACLEMADSMTRFRRFVGGERRSVPQSEMRRREGLYRSVIEFNRRFQTGYRKGPETGRKSTNPGSEGGG